MTKRQYYKKTTNEKLTNLLNSYKNGEINAEEILSKVTFKESVPDVPYFRKTKSGAIACYGVKRESIVLFRDQWIKLSKVFKNGKNCVFNNFFFNQSRQNKSSRTKSSSDETSTAEVNSSEAESSKSETSEVEQTE